MISVHDTGHAGALGELSEFRERFYHCLTGRADALFELTDAVLCADGPVASLAELSLTPEHRRGMGPVTTRSTTAASRSTGYAPPWPACPYPVPCTAESRWPWMFRTGCARTPRAVPSGCSATPTPAARAKPR